MAIKTRKDIYDDYVTEQATNARRYNTNTPFNTEIPRTQNPALNFLGDLYSDGSSKGRAGEIDGKYTRNKSEY